MELRPAANSLMITDDRPKTIEDTRFGWAPGFLSGNNFAILAYAKDFLVTPDFEITLIEKNSKRSFASIAMLILSRITWMRCWTFIGN